MTKEIMEIMTKAEQKYLAIVKEYGMNNRVEELYNNKMEKAWTDIVNKASACVRLGLISQSQVDTLKSKLKSRVRATRKQAHEIYLKEFCGGSEHEAGVQYWMYRNDWTREQAEEFIESFGEEE